MVEKDVFLHLGYLLGVNIMFKLIEWVISKLMHKFKTWKSLSWPFHVPLELYNILWILEPMTLYFFVIAIVDQEG